MITLIMMLIGLITLYGELDRQEAKEHKAELARHEREREEMIKEAIEYSNEIKTRAA